MTSKCYRFVKEDMSSEYGELVWQVGEWQRVDGNLKVTERGLHASLTPRKSLDNVRGNRWFIAEYDGITDEMSDKFCASEMRLVQEIPTVVLKKFALWCAKRASFIFKNNHDNYLIISDTIEMANSYLESSQNVENLQKQLRTLTLLNVTGAAGRALAATISAVNTLISSNAGAWSRAAMNCAYAALILADSEKISEKLLNQQFQTSNVEGAANNAFLSDQLSLSLHKGAAAASIAHASSVSAAKNSFPVESVSDMYYSTFRAYTRMSEDKYINEQDKMLNDLIEIELR